MYNVDNSGIKWNNITKERGHCQIIKQITLAKILSFKRI